MMVHAILAYVIAALVLLRTVARLAPDEEFLRLLKVMLYFGTIAPHLICRQMLIRPIVPALILSYLMRNHWQ